MTLRKANWIAAACLAALSCAGAAQAQDNGAAGVVRISDGKPRTQVQPASFHGHGGYVNSGYGCPTGDCQYGCQNGCYRPCFNGWFQEHYCKNSPDHGYSPPAKYPLQRRGVQYNQYFPYQWYGTPGASYQGAPMVYQPTDTTQLGYSYQHVPFWQPNPAMMPQRPIPAQWHITAPTVNASAFHNYGGYGYGGYGQGGYGGVGCPNCEMQSTPTATPTPATPGAPAPTTPAAPTEATPMPEASLPPLPRQFENAAASGHIRRAIY